jgi:hypothetical protein
MGVRRETGHQIVPLFICGLCVIPTFVYGVPSYTHTHTHTHIFFGNMPFDICGIRFSLNHVSVTW